MSLPSGSTRTTPPPKPPTCWPASASCSIRSSSTPSPTTSAPRRRNASPQRSSHKPEAQPRVDRAAFPPGRLSCLPLFFPQTLQRVSFHAPLRHDARPLLSEPIVQPLVRDDIRAHQDPRGGHG